MIEAPERQIEEFAKAGADSITFHAEATPHANRTLHAIRELGCLAGVAINPGTPVEAVSELRGHADIVLCMTVNPGWGGQSFIESSPAKVERLRPLVGEARIEVDGGIDAATAGPIAAAGASLFVAGSAVFGADDPRRRLRRRSPRPPARPERQSASLTSRRGDQRAGDLLPPGALGLVDAVRARRAARTSRPARAGRRPRPRSSPVTA